MGLFYLEKIMSTYSATKDTCDKMLDELIDLLIDARENNGAGLKNLDVGIAADHLSLGLLEYSVRLTLVKYK